MRPPGPRIPKMSIAPSPASSGGAGGELGESELALGALDVEIAGVVVEREVEVVGLPLLDLADADSEEVSRSVRDLDPLPFFTLQDKHGCVLNR